ncbi:MAG TPA: hypothetical protein VGC67_08750 [Cellulomonas sp.]
MAADQIPQQSGPHHRRSVRLMSATELALATRTDLALIELLEHGGILHRLPGDRPPPVRRFDEFDREWVTLIRGLLATGMPFVDLSFAIVDARETGSSRALLERIEQHRATVMTDLARTVRDIGAVEQALAHLRTALDTPVPPTEGSRTAEGAPGDGSG